MSNEKPNSPKDAARAILAKAQSLLDRKSTEIVESIKAEDLKKSAEFTSGLHKVEYYGLEKHNPQQAALAVLAKAQDMLSETISIRSEGLQKSAEAESGMHKVEYYKSEILEKGNEKGIHTPMRIAGAQGDQSRHGSQAGYHAAHSKKGIAGRTGANQEKGWAVGEHKKVLGEMHSMPKPNLPKSENPDEKRDAQLGEDVEHLCEDHMIANKNAERKEGHKLVSKAECMKCEGGMQKSEFSDLYADLEEMAKSEGQGAGNKKAPSNDMKPRIKEEGTERDYNDFETKPGHAPENDHREAPQAAPQSNPAEQHEGNNPPAGAAPANKTATGATPGTGKKGVHKLSFFMGHQHSKKSMKKGIALG